MGTGLSCSVSQKRSTFEVSRTFEYESFSSQISSFCAVLAQQISINLQLYTVVVANLKVYSPSRVLIALLFKLMKFLKIHVNYE